ncbi:Ig-like domain-containing protein [Pelagerythrobacter marensis]|uniref:Ig-like domain-containing protein n=1 Tax=Pelagerythrobacter marensis TaxID=543877 RepID=A0ABZ2D221_9SPHN
MRSGRWLTAVSLAALASGVFAAETTTYEYDAQGRLIGSSRSGGPASGVINITSYDPAGNRSNHKVAGGTPSPSPPPPPPPPNTPPVANTDYGTMPACSFATFNVVQNDTDADGDYPLKVIAVSGALSPSISGTTSIKVASSGATGGFPINYTVEDSRGATGDGVLYVNVTSAICM